MYNYMHKSKDFKIVELKLEDYRNSIIAKCFSVIMIHDNLKMVHKPVNCSIPAPLQVMVHRHTGIKKCLVPTFNFFNSGRDG